ncbi:hypothetical protein CS022_03685 [Veronia nyctiphanis]|uniref:Flagellin n=1 Tax=Veronia nyctiphanis TaxID=1278244 RepID=A0A4V1LT72_9GAMM|nr:flagellin [Veronia nyctiphanis]RXJ74188.1 hypothetical protein CS022_03685 [Veronia nyctiphanis]
MSGIIFNSYQQSVFSNQTKVQQSFVADSSTKITSGQRIHSAGDDAAGLQLSNRLNFQTSGMNVSFRNINEGLSMLEVADAAIEESTSIFQRVRELAVRASNGSLGQTERDSIQVEITALKDELDRISETTSFGGEKLLNGAFGSKTLQVGADAGEGLSITMPDLTLDKMTMNSDPELFKNANSYFSVKDVTSAEGDYIIWEVEKGPLIDNWIQLNVPSDTATYGSDFGYWNASYDGGNTWGAIMYYGDFLIPSEGSGDSFLVRAPTYDDNTYEGNESFALTIQTIGGELRAQGHIIDDADYDMKDINVNTMDDAQNTINAADGAIRYLDQERSKIAATQNKLEHSLNNLAENQTNIETAKGKILDTDLAKETSKYTLHTMLQNASSAVLSQAKNLPANRLQLMRQLS